MTNTEIELAALQVEAQAAIKEGKIQFVYEIVHRIRALKTPEADPLHECQERHAAWWEGVYYHCHNLGMNAHKEGNNQQSVINFISDLAVRANQLQRTPCPVTPERLREIRGTLRSYIYPKVGTERDLTALADWLEAQP